MYKFILPITLALLSVTAWAQNSQVISVTVLPATCNPGGGPGGSPADHADLWDGSANNTPYYCSAANTWTQLVSPATDNNFQNETVQFFPVTDDTASLVVGTASVNPAPDILQAGSIWINTSGLSNLGPHIVVYDGANYDTLISNNDSTCDLQGCTGMGLAVNQNSPSLITPDIGDATGTSLNLNLSTGDLFDVQAGSGFAVKGSVTSGVFVRGEAVTQTTTGATGFLVGAPVGSNPMLLTAATTGSPDATHTWVGQTSGAVFTPTTTPAVPFIQASPASGHAKVGYGTDGRLQLSNGTNLFSDIIVRTDLTATVPAYLSVWGSCNSTLPTSAGTYVIDPFQTAATSSACGSETTGVNYALSPVTTSAGLCSLTASSGVAATNAIVVKLVNNTQATSATLTIPSGQKTGHISSVSLPLNSLDQYAVTYTISASEAATNLRVSGFCW